jgi:hypothetical protein
MLGDNLLQVNHLMCLRAGRGTTAGSLEMYRLLTWPSAITGRLHLVV